MRTAITPERLRDLFHYDPTTGFFTRLVTRGNTALVGQIAGCKQPRGYITIMVDRQPYMAHRLVWLYVHGEWPEGDLDHINGERNDNRLANLRSATRTQNNGNSKRRSDNASGVKGVCWDSGRRRWLAQIMVGGKTRYLGRFHSREAAGEAYARAAAEVFGEFARAG